MAIRGNKNYYHIAKIQRRRFVNQATQVGISAEEAEAMVA